MFKRILLFMFLIFSFVFLIGCNNAETSQQPKNINKEIYEMKVILQDEIDKCFNDETCDSEKVKSGVGKLIIDKGTELAKNGIGYKTSEEKELYRLVNHLYSYLALYKEKADPTRLKEFKEGYQETHNEISDLLKRKQKY